MAVIAALPVGRMTRRDALPERTDYEDTGCDISPSCLRCPLPQCRYDFPKGMASLKLQQREAALRRLRAEGLTVDQMAAAIGTSRRTVWRLLRRLA